MTVALAEKLLLEKFKKEPFHNLFILYDIDPNIAFGGTCSDKTLSYLSDAREKGLNAYLHSARIGGQEIHRLIRLEIQGKRYFADVGNGWPAIHLYPADKEVTYRCYGMQFRTRISDHVLTVYHKRQNEEKIQMEMDITEKDETLIYKSITERFSSNIKYPFNHAHRFSMIVGNKFLFLRGNRLEIYSDKNYEEISNVDLAQLPKIITNYFNYDISKISSCLDKNILIK